MLKSHAALVASFIFLAACAENGTNEQPIAEPMSTNREVDVQPSPLLAMNLPEISAALNTGDTSSVALVNAYIERIGALDKKGPRLNSILALNPDALDMAAASDERRRAGETLGPLDGVPILVKDNIETKDQMATTAGALALKDNVTGRDSPAIAALRAQGAIILAKTNLSQWANYRSNSSMSGWSALGGQVRNPHILDRNPCGSSSGTGAAVAASFGAGGIGTETNGSIICPSNANGIVGFKPTVGLVAQDYIVPISFTQDTAGPMTKTVAGAAMMLSVMATGGEPTDYHGQLDANSLEGTRIGVLRFSQGENADILEQFNAALTALEAAGATLVDIDEFDNGHPDLWTDEGIILDYEFKTTLNAYLADAAPAVEPRTLEDLIAFNIENADIELALFDQSRMVGAAATGELTDEEYTSALKRALFATRQNGIDALLAENNVDVLVSPSGPLVPRIDPVNGDTWPAWAGAGWMAAIAGYPHLTVPMGSVHGVPIGLSFMGTSGEDAAILSYGYAYEQATMMRTDPAFLPSADVRPEIAGAMDPDQ